MGPQPHSHSEHKELAGGVSDQKALLRLSRDYS